MLFANASFEQRAHTHAHTQSTCLHTHIHTRARTHTHKRTRTYIRVRSFFPRVKVQQLSSHKRQTLSFGTFLCSAQRKRYQLVHRHSSQNEKLYIFCQNRVQSCPQNSKLLVCHFLWIVWFVLNLFRNRRKFLIFAWIVRRFENGLINGSLATLNSQKSGHMQASNVLNVGHCLTLHQMVLIWLLVQTCRLSMGCFLMYKSTKSSSFWPCSGEHHGKDELIPGAGS